MSALVRTAAVALEQHAEATPLPIVMLPPDAAAFLPFQHVVVEVTRYGTVRAHGVAQAKGAAVYLAPPLFATLQDAVVAAHAWARANGIDRIFLRDRSVAAPLSPPRR